MALSPAVSEPTGIPALVDGGVPAVDYARVFAASPAPSVLLGPGWVVRDANPAFVHAVGRSRRHLVGRGFFEALPPDPARESAAAGVLELWERAVRTGTPVRAVRRYDVLDPAARSWRERHWVCTVTPVQGEAGEQLVLCVVDDVTEQGPTTEEPSLAARAKELEELNRELLEARDRLTVQALHDQLTGLLVRSVFVEQLSHALARLDRHAAPIAVLFVDLDRLKTVNDDYGHAAGDELIRCCARRMVSSVRPSDRIARVGGDEFVLLLEDLHDEREAVTVAERILAAIPQPCRLPGGIVVEPTASIGVAVASRPDVSAESLINHADAAMYRAKQAGRGGYALFDEAAYAAASARHQLELDLRQAVRTEALSLHYQPIIDLTTGRTDAVEALLRWQHPSKGLLSAGDFIHVAEGSQLMLELGAWVLAQACRQLRSWDLELGPKAPRRLFVNLSVAELAQPELVHRVGGIAADEGVEPERLVLEITETGMLDEPRDVLGAVQRLQALGCELAIDDFGTGYASLSRLVQLPATILKIDRSFVREVHVDPESMAIVSAVLLLAHNLRRTVVAEGVEDARALATLQELGCVYAQGYHLARPQPPEVLTAMLGAA